MRTTALIKKHFGSVENYLKEHKVDVLCLQEVKISKKRMGECKPEESRFRSLSLDAPDMPCPALTLRMCHQGGADVASSSRSASIYANGTAIHCEETDFLSGARRQSIRATGRHAPRNALQASMAWASL